MGRLKLREERVTWREVEGEVLGLDLQRSTYFAVNETGQALWSRLAAGTTLEDLIGHLVEAHGIGRDHATKDASAFIDALEARDLIEHQ